MIDPRAIIDPTATLGANVQVGAWCVIGESVQIGANCVLATQVIVQAGTRLGSNVRVGPLSVIGSHPLAPPSLAELDSDTATVAIADGVHIAAQSRVTNSIQSP